MKAISTGNTYKIYDDSLVTFDKLPAQNYVVRFCKMTGFYLEKYSDIEIKEKIYGVHETKVDKVLKTFNKFERNLGVILSGDKGIGKSLFAKLLAKKAVENNIPVIIVDSFIPDIASYIESIEQEVLVLFDEFDKTFGDIKSRDGETDAQASMLTLFDGISQGKKLFVITCNELKALSSYIVNRPGRFHYHFRFDYPTGEEIRVYLKDKVKPQYQEEIEKVVHFSNKVALNYDCLRSIGFELNLGISFEEAIKDLNIIKTNNTIFNVIAYFENGDVLTSRSGANLDLFETEKETVYLYDSENNNVADIVFCPASSVYNVSTGSNIILGDKVSFTWFRNDDNDEFSPLKDVKCTHVSIVRKESKKLHYTV